MTEDNMYKYYRIYIIATLILFISSSVFIFIIYGLPKMLKCEYQEEIKDNKMNIQEIANVLSRHYPEEQTALYIELYKTDNEKTRKLLEILDSKYILDWWSEIGIRTPLPFRVYFFQELLNMSGIPRNPILCVVTDDKRDLLYWKYIAEEGFITNSVKVCLFKTPTIITVSSNTKNEVITYKYTISRDNLRQIYETHNPYKVIDQDECECVEEEKKTAP
jgi:hypothetical protein